MNIDKSNGFSDVIQVGNVLTVTPEPSSSVLVCVEYADGSKVKTSVSSATTFGPYLVDMRMSAILASGSGASVVESVSQRSDLTNMVTTTTNPLTGGIAKITSGELDVIASMKLANNRRKNGPCIIGPMFPSGVSVSYTGTASMMLTAPGHFDAVALVAINYDTTATLIIDKIAFAVSERSDTSKSIPIINGTQYNAAAGATDQLGFINGTWAGAASVTVPMATVGPSDGVVIPAIQVSDFTPLSSIERVDDPSKFPLALCRAEFAARTTSTFVFSTAQDVTDINTYMAPYEYYPTAQAVNGVTTPSSMNGASATQTARLFALAFRLRGSSEFVLWAGDSLVQGCCANGDTNPNKPANNWNGFAGLTTKALAKKTSPVGHFNLAWTGMKSANYLARIKSAIPVMKPSMAVYQVSSPNDTDNPNTESVWFARALDFIDTCEQYSVMPVLLVPAPYSGWTNALRVAFIAKVKALRNVLVIDINEPVYDPSNSAQSYWAAATYFDGIHPNAVGHSSIATRAIVPTLRAII